MQIEGSTEQGVRNKRSGEAKKILGMEIARDRQRGTLCLT